MVDGRPHDADALLLLALPSDVGPAQPEHRYFLTGPAQRTINHLALHRFGRFGGLCRRFRFGSGGDVTQRLQDVLPGKGGRRRWQL